MASVSRRIRRAQVVNTTDKTWRALTHRLARMRYVGFALASKLKLEVSFASA